MARNLLIPTTMLVILSLVVTLAVARNIPTAGTTKTTTDMLTDTTKATTDMLTGTTEARADMLTDEKNLHLGLNGFGRLGGGLNVGGLPLIGGIGGYAGSAGGAGLHLGSHGIGGNSAGLGGIGGLGGGLAGFPDQIIN